MARTAILSVRVVSDTKQAQRGAQETATAWEKFEKRLNQASLVAGAAGAGLLKLGNDAYKAASELQQSTGAVETVFKNQAGAITKFAETAWSSVGLSQNKAQEMATIMGSQLKNMGVPMGEIADQSLDLIKLGSDLAATYGGETSQAVEALSSLLRGERDPIERYGVTINQAMLEAEKAALGLDGLTGAAARNADLQATLSLLTKQTADVQGMFAAEADTAAGAAQRNAAQWETVQAQLGTALLPLMTELTQKLSDLAGWVSENQETVQKLAGGLAVAIGVILGFNAAIKATRAVMAVFSVVSGAVTITQNFVAGLTSAKAAASAFTGVAGTLGGKVAAVTKAMLGAIAASAKWAVQTTILVAKLVAQKVAQLAIAAASRVAAVAQGIWNAVMNANPIMLIITLVVAAIALLIMNWETVQQVAVKVWEAITTAAQWFWDNVLVPIGNFIAGAFVAYWQTYLKVVTTVWEAIKTAAMWFWDNVLVPIGNFIAGAFVAYWNTLKAAATAVWNGIKTAATAVWDWLKSVGTWISNTFTGAWNGLRNAGINALNAIISPVQNLISWLRSAWEWVQNIFSSGIGQIGQIFGFEARVVDAGAPVTAAAGSPPRLPALAALKGGSSTVNINIELPQYVGDRTELLDWLREALSKATKFDEGLISV